MINLILAIILGAIFAYLAIHNSTPVSLQLGSYNLTGIPLYFVAFASLIVGVLISGLFSLAGWTSSILTIASKDSQLSKTQHLLADLKNHLQNLEVENAQLREENRGVKGNLQTEKQLAHDQAHLEDHTPHHFNFIDRLRYKLAA